MSLANCLLKLADSAVQVVVTPHSESWKIANLTRSGRYERPECNVFKLSLDARGLCSSGRQSFLITFHALDLS
ncbi:hypothetical protein E2P81_ATG08631 [Venturia nashicola]|nr:hypothetical protein E2P81_ATG08631 [Venturia nashicola]